jgi:hypothetical protein
MRVKQNLPCRLLGTTVPQLVANKAGTVAHHSAVIAGNVKQGREKSR